MSDETAPVEPPRYFDVNVRDRDSINRAIRGLEAWRDRLDREETAHRRATLHVVPPAEEATGA